MATKSQTFVHNRDKIESTEASAAGYLAKDIFDFIEANDDSAIDLTVSHTTIGERVITTVVIANT
ncbi:MAG: hypothetical protein Unbinned2514contig1001_31 [Prokaryotic dsDNA virus sp.]|nr:MAG: hypothetical protein Unbinned2514contig1001_31 [Prokaryotic dsDNA virus sp.]|tara:strand:- start:360 stop:554 length:195 start_codon:yes stop_codon:yes gene_type:complete